MQRLFTDVVQGAELCGVCLSEGEGASSHHRSALTHIGKGEDFEKSKPGDITATLLSLSMFYQ